MMIDHPWPVTCTPVRVRPLTNSIIEGRGGRLDEDHRHTPSISPDDEGANTVTRTSDRGRPAIAVIGCGAIARSFHLPALARASKRLGRIVLVDRDEEQAQTLAAEFAAQGTATNHREVLEQADGAIIAVPPEHHARIVLDFLSAGVPVLCEKPLAISSEEATELVAAASATGVPLAVNNNRRLFPGLQYVRDLMAGGNLGHVRRIEIFDGAPFGWPLASGSMFGRPGGQKGVLQDIGAHVLDTVCWWLGRKPTVLRFRDDSLGGTEAVARLEFEFDGGTGLAHLSWLSNLSNAFSVAGERGIVRGAIAAWDRVTLSDPQSGSDRSIRLRPGVPNPLAVRDHMIDNFLDVVSGEASPLVSGEDVIPSLELIGDCYRGREPFDMPWAGLDGVEYALR